MSVIKRIKFSEVSLKRILKYLFNKFKNFKFSLKWSLTRAGKNEKNKLKKLKDKHANEDVILIANGPSLRKIDLSFFNKGLVLFGMNRIYLHKDIKVDYLCCINDLVTTQFSEEFNNYDCEKFFKYRHNKIIKNSFFFENNLSSDEFSKNIAKGLTSAATVTYASLQILYYMGFKRVFIVGLDHNFNFSGNVNEKQTVTNDENHFVKDYFPKGSKWETPDLLSSEYFYGIANEVYKSNNREIIDCTIDGKCEIFQKGRLSDYLV